MKEMSEWTKTTSIDILILISSDRLSMSDNSEGKFFALFSRYTYVVSEKSHNIHKKVG